MKSYPSIRTIGLPLIDSGRKLPFDLSANNWIGLDKLDGSLIRVEWTDQRGFYKYGRKNGLLDDSNPVLLEAPELIEKNYNFLNGVFKDFGWMRVVAFFEFLGNSSFAGTHKEENHRIHLIDLAVDKKGLVNPKELVVMSSVSGVKVLHKGPITRDIIENIYNRRMKGMTFEGVVFKRINKKGIREMFKTKSKAWYDKLREKCKGDSKLFERLK
jgi:hypothetical protein